MTERPYGTNFAQASKDMTEYVQKMVNKAYLEGYQTAIKHGAAKTWTIKIKERGMKHERMTNLLEIATEVAHQTGGLVTMQFVLDDKSKRKAPDITLEQMKEKGWAIGPEVGLYKDIPQSDDSNTQ